MKFKIIIKLISLIFMLLISESIFSQANLKNNTNTFLDPNHPITFRFPTNWSKQVPQLKSTLVLLYENNGSNATCNLSVVSSNNQNIEEYNSKFIKNNFNTVYKNITNIEDKIDFQLGNKISKIDFIAELQLGNKLIKIKSKLIILIHKGLRYTLVINCPINNQQLIKNDIQTITNTLMIDKER